MKYLYAEDNPADADLLRAHFAAAAPEVQIDVADSGEACLRKLAADRFDLLLLDNHLPDMDGLAVLRELRERGHTLPVVMVTGAGDDRIVWRALHEGANDYVPKSADYLDGLPQLLATQLRRHRDRSLLDRADRKRQHRVLYVEPNAMDAELTLAHFAQCSPDLQLHVVASADHGLVQLDGHRDDRAFDLVLTDLRLPGMSAMEFMRAAQHRDIEVPFVVITGRGDEATAVALLRLGAYDYIVKRDNYLVQLPHALRHALHRFELDNVTRGLQAELMALNASLERKVAQRTAQLQAEVQARLQAQADLQRSEDLLKMAGRMARLGAWMIDLPARGMVWSEELAQIYEAHVDCAPSLEDFIASCEPPGRETMQARLDACLRDGAPFDEEVQIATAVGRIVWVRVIGQAVRDANGGLLRVQGTVQDIDERKQAEAHRQDLEARLRESQKLEAIGTFAGGIAHDFNNMLGAMLGHVALARGEVEPQHPVQFSLGLIHQTAARGRGLVQQILAFCRRQPPSFVAQPLRRLVDEAIAMLRPMLPAIVRVDAVCRPTPVWIEADGTQVQQVLMNLCVNAWHAMRGGPGHIEIGLDIVAPDQAAAAPAHAPRAHLWVRDDGCGMDAATRTRIFEPFFTTKSGHGTGLGLAVVHGIVAAHRGSIVVDSAPGQGSVFHLYFPLAEPRRSEAPALPQDEADDAPFGARVLYVDDDEVMALVVERLLQRAGVRVTVFQDARAALQQVRCDAQAFDVVVCDYNMPTLTGVDLARALGGIAPQLPVIISSGYLPDEARAEAMRLGVRGIVHKENIVEDLGRLIRQVLAQQLVN
ncbi:response regulator [Caldimonas sp. KR1-144]|uniref:response regulator n=1 Tax=Caldimonas sp. KR1-144 TaxID=3400911 RepID=UPI003C0A6533